MDSDFEALRRDEVKQYIEERYGQQQVCSLGTYITLQAKAAFRDFAKIVGLPRGSVELVSAIIESEAERRDPSWTRIMEIAQKVPAFKAIVKRHPEIMEWMRLCLGSPRGQGVHACGMIILPSHLHIKTEFPVRKGEKDGRETLVSEWEGSEMELAGYLKEDILGINQLDKFRRIITLVKEYYKEDVDIYSIPLDEPQVYKMFCQGFNGDVFHLGSKGLTAYGKEVQPAVIEDLIAMIALYRPGPMESGTHHQFVRMRKGGEQPTYHPLLEDITRDTLGLLIYQEQIIQAATKIGNLSLAEGDEVRRNLTKKREELKDSRDRFIAGYLEKGIDESKASEVWDVMVRFASYGFNKCISGRERIRSGRRWVPTVEEMYLIKNDAKYAARTGHLALHGAYKYGGYGRSYSLNREGRLVVNTIENIRPAGLRRTYRITLSSGRSICTTDNHGYPTPKGKRLLSELKVGDELFVKGEYQQERYGSYNSESLGINSEKGKMGFQRREGTGYLKFVEYRSNHKKDYCELCGKSESHLEVHHKDGTLLNNELENFITLCSSCHKKEHYKLGRNRRGERGLPVILDKIVSIEFECEEMTYDVTMRDPYHTFINDDGIVTCNSHAAVYASTGYISQYLKWKYPLAYWTAAFEMVSDPEKIPGYMSEINRSNLGISVAVPDVNHSTARFFTNVEQRKIFWALTSIKYCGEGAVEGILAEREKNGEYFTMEEFYSRVHGSKINRRTVENLIYAGAFDILENISQPSQRLEVLVKFYEIAKIAKKDRIELLAKIEQTPEMFEDWWWFLRQRDVCGMGTFDFKSLIQLIQDREHRYQEIASITHSDYPVSKAVGGIVVEVVERESKKGKFCQVKIEENYEPLWIVFWSEIWQKKEVRDRVLNSKGGILTATGLLQYDSYKKEMVLQTTRDSVINVYKNS